MICSATCSSFSKFRLARATRAPACASAMAQAWPMPCDAPVTNATRSFSNTSPLASPRCCLGYAGRQERECFLQTGTVFDVARCGGAINLAQQSAEHTPWSHLHKAAHAKRQQLAHARLP